MPTSNTARNKQTVTGSGAVEDRTPAQCTRYVVKATPTRSLRTHDYEEFLAALGEHPGAPIVSMHSHWERANALFLKCAIDVGRCDLEASVDSDDVNLVAAIHEKAREIFGAWNPPAEELPSLGRFNVKRTAFLADRFDDTGRAVDGTLTRFLSRLGLSVVEGEGYEARGIPNKVADRITAQDIFVCLITPGEHTWIMSEAAFAKAQGKYIVVLAQDGSSSVREIMGSDHEHIAFPAGNIEKAYADLVYALPVGRG